jgi:acyl homoserine lactone synthase
MTTAAMGSSRQLTANVMTLMHRFRHDVFVKRLGWFPPLANGLERDQYDTEDAKYLVMMGASGTVTACARLLPTTGAYMLPDLFPQLLDGCAPPRSCAIWELSRFATSVRETREGRILSLSQPTLDLLELVLVLARQQKVARLILVTSIGIERLMLRAGVAVDRIAPPSIVDGNLCVALFIAVPPGISVE